MYQDDNVSAIVELNIGKEALFTIYCKINIIIILKYLQHTVQTKTQFFCSFFGTRKMNGVDTTICCKKNNVGRIDQNMGRNDQIVSN